MQDSGKPLRLATRLNAFRIGAAEYWPSRNRITTIDLLERAASAKGINAADLNYPDHFNGCSPANIGSAMANLGLQLNGLAMRYYGSDALKLGAFTHPDGKVRRSAIDMTLRGIDTLSQMGGRLMTLWLGQDGFDYSFQVDYARLWDETVAALGEVARYNPDIKIAIEYKPDEPRAFSLLPDVSTTLLMLTDVGAPNLGVTLDFAHVLYAGEMPACSASLIARRSQLLGIHLNDGYGKRDDGLIAGSVHPIQTVELLVEALRCGYDGAIYFDTFPDHSGLDPVAEAEANVEAVNRFVCVARSLCENSELAVAIARQDAPASQRIVSAALYGENG